MEYRNADYFNNTDTFVFQSSFSAFKSKCHFDKGHWWTNKMGYKCTSLKSCKK